MDKVTGEERENIIMYTTYTMLYANDFALNNIKDLAPFIKNKDKRIKMLYGSMMRRVRAYYEHLHRISGDEDWFLADYEGTMDDICEKNAKGFKRSVKWVLHCNKIPEEDFLSSMELARASADLSVSTVDELMYQLDNYGIPKGMLNHYRLTEVDEIMNLFAERVVKSEGIVKNVNLNQKKSVMNYFDKLRKSLLSFDSFDESIARALHEENIRKKSNG